MNQAGIISFNSGKYDLNMIKRYFVEQIAKDESERITAAKKDKECKVKKVMFPYE